MNRFPVSRLTPASGIAFVVCLLASTLAVKAVPVLTAASPTPALEGGPITVELTLSEPAPGDCEFRWQLAPVAGVPALVVNRESGDIDPVAAVTGAAPSLRGDRNGIVRVQPGATSVRMTFSALDDYWMEPREQLELRFMGGINITLPAAGPVLTVLDNDGMWYSSADSFLKGPPFYYYRKYFLSPLDNAPAAAAVPIESDFTYMPPDFTSGSVAPARCAMTDFNRDGVPDIVSHYVQGSQYVVKGLLGGVPAPQNVWFDHTVHGDATDHGTIACGDLDGDGQPEIITGRGAGTAPTVTVWSTGGVQEIKAAWNVFDGTFPGGVNVAAGDLDGDGRDEIVVAAGPHGGPLVQWWKWTAAGPVLGGSFWAYGLAMTDGVAVGVGDTDGDGKNEIICLPDETRGTSLLLVIFDTRKNYAVRNFLVPNPWFVTFDVPYKRFWVTGLPGRPGFPQNRIIYGTSSHDARMVHPDNSVTVMSTIAPATNVNVSVWPVAEPRRSSLPQLPLPVLSLVPPESGSGIQWAAAGLVPGGEYDVETSTDLRNWSRVNSFRFSSTDRPFAFSSPAAEGKRFWRMAVPSVVAGSP